MTVFFTDEQITNIKNEICLRISSGETLRAICREEDKPTWVTIYRWLEADVAFKLHFAQARELGFDAIAEEALQIADTPIEGIKYENGPLGSKEVREDMLGHRKLQIETRLKLLAKWSPKKYGERVDHVSTDGSMSPNPTVIELVAPDK
jgi:hypothetical protein